MFVLGYGGLIVIIVHGKTKRSDLSCQVSMYLLVGANPEEMADILNRPHRLHIDRVSRVISDQ